MSEKVLIVDDDKDLSNIIMDLLESYGYESQWAGDSEEAFEILTHTKFHLIILDINLPTDSGFEVCKELRKVSKVPVIFASARTSEDDKITGLDIGGDDYIAKPYSLKELLARVKALLRRTYGDTIEKKEIIFGNVIVNPELRRVIKNGEEIKLALKEFDLLMYMLTHQNESLKKETILHEVWGAFSEAENATVSVHIRWLREKLEDNPAKPQFIKTVWGIGYQFVTQEEGK